MSKTIAVDDLGNEIARQLAEYSADVAEGVKKAVKETGKECVREIRRNIITSGLQEYRKGDPYSKAWRSTSVTETATGTVVVVNAGKEYRLTHLLEKGHAIVGKGGRTNAYPHIAPAERNAGEYLEKKVKLIVKGEF